MTHTMPHLGNHFEKLSVQRHSRKLLQALLAANPQGSQGYFQQFQASYLHSVVKWQMPIVYKQEGLLGSYYEPVLSAGAGHQYHSEAVGACLPRKAHLTNVQVPKGVE